MAARPSRGSRRFFAGKRSRAAQVAGLSQPGPGKLVMKKLSFAFALVAAVSLAACGGKSKAPEAPEAGGAGYGGDTYGAPAAPAAEAPAAEAPAAPATETPAA